jgi:hypothetical protein
LAAPGAPAHAKEDRQAAIFTGLQIFKTLPASSQWFTEWLRQLFQEACAAGAHHKRRPCKNSRQALLTEIAAHKRPWCTCASNNLPACCQLLQQARMQLMCCTAHQQRFINPQRSHPSSHTPPLHSTSSHKCEGQETPPVLSRSHNPTLFRLTHPHPHLLRHAPHTTRYTAMTPAPPPPTNPLSQFRFSWPPHPARSLRGTVVLTC